LLDGPVNTELSALREDDVAPLPTEFVRSFWSDRPLPDEPLRPSISTRPHRWFNELMRRTPSGWPPLSNLQVVRYQPPSYGKTERLVTPQWTNAKSTIIGNADSKLLHSLDHVQLWRDPFHMERAGAELLAPWLAQQLTPYLGQPSTDPSMVFNADFVRSSSSSPSGCCLTGWRGKAWRQSLPLIVGSLFFYGWWDCASCR